MRPLFVWCWLPAATIALLLVLRRAYARHASGRTLAALGLATAAVALASAGVGLAVLSASIATQPLAVDGAGFGTGLLLMAVGLVTALLLGDALRRIRTPEGGLRVASGDRLPSLPVRDVHGEVIDASKLLGPRGALFVWYRGLT